MIACLVIALGIMLSGGKEKMKKKNVIDEKEYHKCSREKGFCPTLEDLAQPCGNGSPKGLSFYAVFDMAMLDREQVSLEEATSVIGVVYREKAGDRGVMLNYCPWCGQRLLPPKEEQG